VAVAVALAIGELASGNSLAVARGETDAVAVCETVSIAVNVAQRVIDGEGDFEAERELSVGLIEVVRLFEAETELFDTVRDFEAERVLRDGDRVSVGRGDL
jgi:hypothetical protein